MDFKNILSKFQSLNESESSAQALAAEVKKQWDRHSYVLDGDMFSTEDAVDAAIKWLKYQSKSLLKWPAHRDKAPLLGKMSDEISANKEAVIAQLEKDGHTSWEKGTGQALNESESSAQALAAEVYQKFNEIGSDMPVDIVSTEDLVDIIIDHLDHETGRAVSDNREAVVAELNKMSGSTSWQFGTDDFELDGLDDEQNDFDMPLESKSESKEREYVCVHAKKYAPYECHAKTSYEAAKKAAEHWGMKSTAGIDVHPAGELTAVNESLKDIFNRLSTELLGENQITMSPAQQNTQVIKKDDQVIGTVTNPGLASQLKRGIESGEVSLSQEMNEDSGHSILDIISPKELEELKGYVSGDRDDFYGSEVYNKLYDYYLESGMPYGTAKGRTGDPDKWILDRVEQDYGSELSESESSQHGSDKSEDISDEELLSMLSDKDSVSGSERDKERELLRNLYNMSKHEELDETSMASMPNNDSDFGANLGAGRSSVTLEGIDNKKGKKEMNSKKLNEGAQQEIEAARLLGKAHGLKCQEYYGKTYENPEEARAYHEGYKEGLDECVGESSGMPHDDMSMDPSMAIAEPMADPMADPMDMPGDLAFDLEEEETQENAFTSALANTEKGDKFTVGGKTFTNRTDVGEETFAFEAWDRELKGLLNEETNEIVNEGMSVSISKGQQHTPDQVTVTASDSDADELMSLIKTAGLGMFGDEQPVSDYGSPEVKHPEIGDHDQMMSLIKSVDSHSDECNVCSEEEEVEEAAPLVGAAVKAAAHGAGAAVANRAMDKMSEEDESDDVMDFLHSLDEGEHYVEEEDLVEETENILRDQSGKELGVGDIVRLVGNSWDSGEDYFEWGQAEKRQGKVGKIEDLDSRSGTHYGIRVKFGWNSILANPEDLEIVEQASGETMDEGDEHLNEWANDAGKKGTDEAFEQDIEFMTKVISGGLNKPKADQTTLPHTKVKVEGESPDDWKKLAGIK